MLVGDGRQGGEGGAAAGDRGQVGGADLVQQGLLPVVEGGALDGEELPRPPELIGRHGRHGEHRRQPGAGQQPQPIRRPGRLVCLIFSMVISRILSGDIPAGTGSSAEPSSQPSSSARTSSRSSTRPTS